MATRKRKICDEGNLLAVNEEELAYDSDSDVKLVVVACVALSG
jgi:hypothetical protein